MVLSKAESLDDRPTPRQRSSLELLRYLTNMGPAQIRFAKGQPMDAADVCSSMSRLRTRAVLGLAGCALFWTSLLVLGAIRPGYSHVVNAISELGARGTPHAVLWNVFGFIIPGVLLALAGHAIGTSVRARRAQSGGLARALLVVFGLTIAGQGLIPAVMSNGELVTTSWSTTGHLVMSLVSGAAWLAALALLIAPMKRSPQWRGWQVADIGAILLVIVLAFIPGRRLPGGLAQRLADAVVLGWFVAASAWLIRLEGRRGSTT